MFGVVRCPRCKRPQAVRLMAKTKTCQCGKKISLATAQILHSTDEPRELPEVMGRIRAQISGQQAEFEEALEAGAALEAKDRISRRERERMVLETLKAITEQEGGFDLERAEAELKAMGLEPTLLKAMIRENVLYEVARGVYGVV